MVATETIAAIATAAGNAGIGIVRVSGNDALLIVSKIFKPANKDLNINLVPSHTIHYGYLVEMLNGQTIDEVLVMIMKGPRSFTAEDTVEINCHGGMIVMKRILQEVVRAGARIAEPGEFTKRAFLNGRMDLAQAEAVMDIIDAKNQYALKTSLRQLGGAVSSKIRVLREKILYQIAYIESALDDPEHISLDGYGTSLMKEIDTVLKEIDCLLSTADGGKVIKEGVRTVILGKPNAGKSSLMNLLVGEDRAIVTDIAGTTRDVLEEQIHLKGISLNLVDTAGIRSTEDVVERIGVERAKETAQDADLIIYIVDASCPLDENDDDIIQIIGNKQAIVLLNKSDLEMEITRQELEEKTHHKVLMISAKEMQGIEALESEIEQMFYKGKIDFNDQVYITNVRHKTALEQTKASLEMVCRSIDNGMPEDFYSIDLMDAYEQLGVIIGESIEDDLVNEIFSRFCTGK